MIQIDNKKMWESLWKNMEDSVYRRDIELALKDQGLTVNEQGEIVSIEPEKKNNEWHVCTKDCYLKSSGEYLFSKGKLYKTTADKQGIEWVTSDVGHIYLYDYYSEYFRPATDEEIARYNSALPAPERDNYDEIKQAEIPQDSQRIVSAKAKEVLFSGEEKEYLKRELGVKDSDFVITKSKQETSDGELTEFEKTLANICNGWIGYEIGWEDYINENADVLLSLAKKELIDNINPDALTKAWCIDMQLDSNGEEAYWFKKGIENILNKLNEE